MGRKSKFSDAQIIGFIKELEGGAKVTEVARRVGVSAETIDGRQLFLQMGANYSCRWPPGSRFVPRVVVVEG
jgi:transposase-like protein